MEGGVFMMYVQGMIMLGTVKGDTSGTLSLSW
jgi:hypothetical protein